MLIKRSNDSDHLNRPQVLDQLTKWAKVLSANSQFAMINYLYPRSIICVDLHQLVLKTDLHNVFASLLTNPFHRYAAVNRGNQLLFGLQSREMEITLKDISPIHNRNVSQ